MSYVSVCIKCESNFTKFSMKDPVSYCDTCNPNRARQLNKKNIYNRKRTKEESDDDFRIRLVEEGLKELKNVFESVSDASKKQIAKEVGTAIFDTMAIATKNITEDMREQKESIMQIIDTHVSTEFEKQNSKFQKQLAILNTRMMKLTARVDEVDKSMTEHLHYYATKLNLQKKATGNKTLSRKNHLKQKKEEGEK